MKGGSHMWEIENDTRDLNETLILAESTDDDERDQ